MSTEVLELPEVKSDNLAPITVFQSEITRMRNEFSGLKIIDLNDKKGFEAVSAARIEAMRLRTSVDKVRKRLKEESLAWGRAVDATAKEIREQIESIENPLSEMEETYKAQVAEKKAEAERLRKEKIQDRVLRITSLDALFNGIEYKLGEKSITQDQLESSSDNDFQTVVESFEAEYKILLDQRLEAERVAREEADRLEAQRKEQEAAAAEIKRQQDELAAERKKMDDEKAAHEAELKRIQDEKDAEIKRQQDEAEEKEREVQRQAELAIARKEAAEKAINDAKIKADKDAADKAEAERVAAKKEAKALAKRPDLEKYNDMVSQLATIVNAFEFKTDEGKQAKQELKDAMNAAVKMNPLKSK